MKNIKIIVEYEGTNYSGWQRQKNSYETIQEKIENALLKITNEKTSVAGSGRTDAGVHAIGQVANFLTSSTMSEEKLCKALNSVLPRDITVKSLEEVSAGFHPRVCSKKKTYFYKILNRAAPPALDRKTCWYIPQQLDVDLMNAACACLTGKHDFAVFANADASVKTTVRTIFSANIKRDGDFIIFTVSSDGFLKRMVRLIVGTLVRVGRKTLTVRGFEKILKSGEKTRDVVAAPPQGLFLENVEY
ncbi:MAG: tRNA pseudouridine(38-40) synthase TruA [Candidatus Mycalebacterium zealandia]|nr:MAG: tRNA pseudouridine(38-40) synthase TruA [Candidatus Mycalebacterium zealandia]